MKLRIAICDDKQTARDNLRIELEKIIEESDAEIVYEFSGGRVCANWISSHPGEVDLLFLDVEMDDGNGMEAAKRIREKDGNLFIVFVTGYADYVFEGYRVGALDYLTKPIASERLREVLLRVRKHLVSQGEECFVFRNGDGMYRLPYDDILYFFSDRRYVNVVTEHKTYTFYGKLREVAERTGGDFVRIHQRYLVNSGSIAQLGNDSVTVKGADGARLPISRAYREEAVGKLARAILRNGE